MKETGFAFQKLYGKQNRIIHYLRYRLPDHTPFLFKAPYFQSFTLLEIFRITPQNLDVERKINFHEPHPEKKVPFRTCRRYGRRLNRAYGWTGDMFILEN
jgi:hypothetical protein